MLPARVSDPSEARAIPEPARRLYVSIAVRPAAIEVSYGLESTEGERFTLRRRYRPPHGGTDFVSDLTALCEALLEDAVLDVALKLLISPVK